MTGSPVLNKCKRKRNGCGGVTAEMRVPNPQKSNGKSPEWPQGPFSLEQRLSESESDFASNLYVYIMQRNHFSINTQYGNLELITSDFAFALM